MFDVATKHVIVPVDDFIEAAGQIAMQIHEAPSLTGDILVFMPGEAFRVSRSQSEVDVSVVGSEEIENCVGLLKRAGRELREESMNVSLQTLCYSIWC